MSVAGFGDQRDLDTSFQLHRGGNREANKTLRHVEARGSRAAVRVKTRPSRSIRST